MNIYRISQTENFGYDTYDSAVVFAEDEEAARNVLPWGGFSWDYNCGEWASSPKNVCVEYLGVAEYGNMAGVIVASFNAG